MKNKIVFAGFMGAILMSVGAANAATTTIATKGYVDSRVDLAVESLESTTITPGAVDTKIGTAINNLNLGTTYQTLGNKADDISAVAAGDQATKYPSVKAIVDYVPKLSDADKTVLQNLNKTGGLVETVAGLDTDVEKLKGSGEGSVAKSIADAISNETTRADAKYQTKSTADLQVGTTGGVFRDMTTAEKAALASGVTAAKVTAYDKLAGDASTPGSVANLKASVDAMSTEGGAIATLNTTVDSLDDVVNDPADGLVKKVGDNKDSIAANSEAITENAAAITANTTSISDNTRAIAANAEALAKKIEMPAACTSENSTCVLMVRNNVISWSPVTTPVDDTTLPVAP